MSKMKLGPSTLQELVSFLNIQEALSRPFTLVCHNPNKVFWINLDTFKKFGFRAIIFYTIFGKAILEKRWRFAATIQPVFFLLRLLALIKRNYWPTKLEIAGFIWVVKKVKYIIESSKSNIII